MTMVVIDQAQFGPLSESEQMGIARVLLGRPLLFDDVVVYIFDPTRDDKPAAKPEPPAKPGKRRKA